MEQAHVRFLSSFVAVASVLAGSGAISTASAADAAPAPAHGAALLGGALPGGAVISARSVALAPVSGGPTTGTPIASDGTFRAAGLQPGAYRLAVTSVTVPKQTQGATFGEKVNAGLHAARLPDPNSMPARISMNVTVGKQTRRVAVDDTVIDVVVDQGGLLAGRVAAP
jgi:hypothetical protein